ncbi:MAG: YhdH/YhfP family quinone oxidoreductase [Paralcaligenes sp.]
MRTYSGGVSPARSQVEYTSLESLSPGDVVIHNRYAGINYKDCLSLLGRARIVESYPRVCGIELVGEVIHSSDSTFERGQSVLVHGFGTGIALDGGFSEYSRVPAAHVMLRPDGLSDYETAVLGVPGFTVALALDRFEQAGFTPADGPVAVTGASGAVGMLAISILSNLGYRVVAVTRKTEQAGMLLELGAMEVLDSAELTGAKRPLEKARFAAAIDNVGGATLASLLRSTQQNGQVASVGNASGNSFDGSVLPFIMRGVSMFGVVANASWPVRRRVWSQLATKWKPKFDCLAPCVQTIELQGLLAHSQAQLEGTTVGRTLISLG